MLAVLCLSLSLPVFILLHHFTTTTGLKEEEEASLKVQHWTQNLRVTKTVVAEDKARKNSLRSTGNGTKTPKSAQESPGKTV